MTQTALLTRLQHDLQAEVTRLALPVHDAIARRAQQRLQLVVTHFPAFALCLIEPWQATLDQAGYDCLLACAKVHLYARILDDALDENLPIYRLSLLRAQPSYWQACSTLGARYPLLLNAMQALISDTVHAVEADDQRTHPSRWGVKNHHLLLAPLLLSANSPAYQAARPGLSALIALVQAGDEWEQGILRSSTVQQALLQQFPRWLDPQQLNTLHTHGWISAARRLVRDGQALLHKLNPISPSY